MSTGGRIGGGAAGEAIVGLHRPRPGPNGAASNLGGNRLAAVSVIHLIRPKGRSDTLSIWSLPQKVFME